MLRIKDYPKEIRVGENDYEVCFVRNIGDKPGSKYTTFGGCNDFDCKIYIKLGQSAEERLITLVHELLHAVEAEYGIEIPHDLINKLEKPLAKLIIDNIA